MLKTHAVHMYTFTGILFSYNPQKAPASISQSLSMEPAVAFPQASRGVGSVLILLFAVVRTETKASLCRPRFLLFTLQDFYSVV